MKERVNAVTAATEDRGRGDGAARVGTRSGGLRCLQKLFWSSVKVAAVAAKAEEALVSVSELALAGRGSGGGKKTFDRCCMDVRLKSDVVMG